MRLVVMVLSFSSWDYRRVCLLRSLPKGYKCALLKNEFGDIEIDSQVEQTTLHLKYMHLFKYSSDSPLLPRLLIHTRSDIFLARQRSQH
jgi:hypothetical protein